MQKSFLLLVATLCIANASMAIAEDKPATATVPTTTSVNTAATTAPKQTPTTPAPQPVFAELKDGSKIEMNADGLVMVINTDGSKTPVPDGVLTLKDGVTFSVKDGKRVAE